MNPTFIEKPITGVEPARCVDGRRAMQSAQGPQMLGGTIHPIVLDVIYRNVDLDGTVVTDNVGKLNSLGFKTGGHRGSHAEGEASDCGAADRLVDILKTAVNQKQEISQGLGQVYEQNHDLFASFKIDFPKAVENAFERIQAYHTDKVKISGNELVSKIEESGSAIEYVQGDHAEGIAFVNINPEKTLDTALLNEQGQQAFNLDLLPAVMQAAGLGVDQGFAIAASLILYQATEMVLVEQKGKPALQISIHA